MTMTMLLFLAGALALAAESGVTTATVRVKQPPAPTPHCGILHLVSLALVEPVEGLPEGPLWVAISCPEMRPALEAGALACMTLSPENPGWPRPVNVPEKLSAWRYALEIRAGACD